MKHFRNAMAAMLGACVFASSMALAGGLSTFQLPPHAGVQNPIVEGEMWEILRGDVVDDHVVLQDGENLLSLDAPISAFDSATVPFSISQRPGTDRITKMTVVVDENPMPVVGVFTFGPLMGELNLESRVRFDVYSNLRVIAETETGESFMAGRFVQAAGGCSAAVTRDIDVALSTMGKMKLRHLNINESPQQSTKVEQVQLMIRHPMFTGMQVHKGTFDHIDPRFVEDLKVWLGEDMLFHMEGGFSISEDPSFRFSYINNGAQVMRVRAVDTDGAVFEHSFPINQGS
ncbi:MAG: quinoprotein dehydrogenase-associated SoxYZ-like carrier [Aliishimia sp.]